jgi:hypothetical protein
MSISCAEQRGGNQYGVYKYREFLKFCWYKWAKELNIKDLQTYAKYL